MLVRQPTRRQSFLRWARAPKQENGEMSDKNRLELIRDILFVIGGICLIVGAVILGKGVVDDLRTKHQQEELHALMSQAASERTLSKPVASEGTPKEQPADPEKPQDAEKPEEEMVPVEEYIETPTSMLPEYAMLYDLNPDIIGWLSIEGTRIDYPVMQTERDLKLMEEQKDPYYLRRDFYERYNSNGCLFADIQSRVGTGKRSYDYEEGVAPGTNLMIFGHHMRSKEMFGELDLYAQKAYGTAHPVICFDSLYEHREYAVMAAFRAEVYYVDQDAFKYYQFFQAENEEQFRYFYDNVKALSLYDTGVTAEFGDELITLITCDNSSEYGRFVVVGKRIQ